MIFDALNSALIADAINFSEDGTPSPLTDFDREIAVEAVFTCVAKYAAPDFNDYWIESVETKRILRAVHRGNEYEFSFVCDLELRSKSDNTLKIPDWKTKASDDFDYRWDERYRESWQPYVYALGTGAQSIEFRGITRALKTRTLVVKPQSDRLEQVPFYLASTVDTIKNLAENYDLFPQHMPSSCKAFGRECEYLSTCRTGDNPRIHITPDSRISFSDSELFWLCPERYRLKELRSETMTDSEREAPNFGLAVHRGLAAVYTQLQNLQKDTQ